MDQRRTESPFLEVGLEVYRSPRLARGRLTSTADSART
ncbi:hypothetical protein NJ7G_2418 [Natrinema sp. J7-2]|nr:hypothetical protein NJ7G_2418 [Natrinema sp. J7-2]